MQPSTKGFKSKQRENDRTKEEPSQTIESNKGRTIPSHWIEAGYNDQHQRALDRATNKMGQGQLQQTINVVENVEDVLFNEPSHL